MRSRRRGYARRVPTETCFRHHGKHASYRCQQCSRPICDRCTFNARFCSRRCNKAYSKFISNYDGPVRSEGVGMGKVLLALALMIAGGVAVWFARSRGLF